MQYLELCPYCVLYELCKNNSLGEVLWGCQPIDVLIKLKYKIPLFPHDP